MAGSLSCGADGLWRLANWLQALVAAALTAAQWPLFMKLPPPALPTEDDWLLRWKVARREPPVWQAFAWAWQLRRGYLLQAPAAMPQARYHSGHAEARLVYCRTRVGRGVCPE